MLHSAKFRVIPPLSIKPMTFSQLMHELKLPPATLAGTLDKLVKSSIIEKIIISNKPHYRLAYASPITMIHGPLNNYNSFREVLDNLSKFRTFYLILYKLAEMANLSTEQQHFITLIEYIDFATAEYLDKTIKTNFTFIQTLISVEPALSNILPSCSASLQKLAELLKEKAKPTVESLTPEEIALLQKIHELINIEGSTEYFAHLNPRIKKDTAKEESTAQGLLSGLDNANKEHHSANWYQTHPKKQNKVLTKKSN